MIRGLWTLWFSILPLGLVAVVLAARSGAHAERVAGDELRRLDSLVERSRTLLQLRASKPRWSDASAPEGALAGSLSAALVSCGLPASTLGSLSPESEVAGAGVLRVRHQRATITLAPITLSQFGAFLEAWRRREPAWTPSSIEIAPDGRAGAPGADLALRAVVTIECSRVQNGGGE